MATSVVWTSSGLTDDNESITVNYYEGNSINASVSAVLHDNIGMTDTTLYVILSTLLSGITYTQSYSTQATLIGNIGTVFSREIKYLVDNTEPGSRRYETVDSIDKMLQKKLFMYSYFKEQIPEKEIDVVATAYSKSGNTYTQVDIRTFKVTVINTFNDSAIITSLLNKHENLEIEA